MKKAFIFMLLTIFAFTTADAQILKNQKKRAEKRAQQRAKNKAQNKVDRKVDEAVDDAFESIGSLFKKKKKKQETNPSQNEEMDGEEMEDTAESMSDMMAIFGGGKSAADYNLPNSYEFDTEVHTKITTINKRGKEETNDFNYLLSDKVDYMGYVVEDAAFGIMDMGRMKMITVVAEQNMAMIMDMSATLDMAERYNEDNPSNLSDIEDVKIIKTGKTKMIAGYTCTQYLMDSKDTEGEMWKAEGFDKMDLMKMGASMGQLMKQNKDVKMPDGYAEMMQGGFLFEGNFYDKKSKERTIMLVEEVMAKDRTIDLTKYKLMDMSQFMKK